MLTFLSLIETENLPLRQALRLLSKRSTFPIAYFLVGAMVVKGATEETLAE